MNSKEIKEALKIIKEPITVNCIEYKYFDDENYNKLLKVYENCLWFANNFEQFNLTIENLQKENQKLKEQLQQKDNENKELCKKIKTNEKSRRKMQKSLMEKLQQKEDIINKAKEFAKEHIFQFDGDKDFDALLEILDNKGE